MVIRRVLAGGSFLVAMVVAPVAMAQLPSVALTPGGVTKTNAAGVAEQDAGPSGTQAFNYFDCVTDTKLEFALTIDDPNMASDHLVVLAGPSVGTCIPGAGVKTIPTGCWPVTPSIPVSSTMSVSVRARDVTAFIDSAATLPTTYAAQNNIAKACQSQSCPGPVTLALTFLIEAADDTVPAAERPGSFTPFFAGTLGPQAPGAFKAGVGDGFVTLTWEPPSDKGIYGYNVYCENFGRVDGSVPDASGSPDASGFDAGSLAGICPTTVFSNVYTMASCSGTTTTDSGMDAPMEIDTGLGVPTSTDGALSTGPVDTPSGISQIPDSYRCAYPGSAVDGATTLGAAVASATVPLSNFDFYTFGVAAVDSIGNVGAIAPLQCGTPGPIRDFWYNYVADGGLAGGGYCALEGVGMPAGSACMTVGVGFAAASLIRRRRRRR